MVVGSLRHRTVVGLLTMSLVASCTAGSSTSPDSTSPDPGPTTTDELLRGPVVRLSEVHYHSSRDDPAEEFVELANVGDQSVELQEWCIKGLAFCFVEPTTLPAGGYVIVRQDLVEGTLANNGERLELVDALGQVIDAVEYDDEGLWSPDADGGGLSLQRTDFEGQGTDPESWEAAPPSPGLPFDPEIVVEDGDVVITEVHYHPLSDDPAEVFVEVMNVSDAPLDLQGWCIRGTGFCWDVVTPIGAGGVVAAVGAFADGKVSRRRDRLRVIDPNGRVHDTVSYEDRGQWPALADGEGSSLQRRDLAAPGSLPANWDIGEPTPGTPPTVIDAPLLPMFADVEFTVQPEPDAPIEVSANVTDADQVKVMYVVGFGAEAEVAAQIDDGQVTATIPGQAAGSLVRFRLVGTGAAEGTWPRRGDGAVYEGTVVADPAAEATRLPRVQWFIADDVWDEARLDTKLQGNNGYPAVLALDGRIIDNVKIRIKGNQARSNKKKKWKVILPAGHEWDAGGLIEDPVDQFDLLPGATDKSFSREILVSDMQTLSGGLSQQVFPIRLERNGEFFGLYMYGESPEGDWRERMGFSDRTYVWKAELVSKMQYGDLDYDRAEFRRHYERITMRHLDDNDELLRDLIRTINELSGERLVRWAYQHIDIPQVVEAIATMRIVQHAEWQHKNHFFLYDPADERWRMVPIDFDLTFGRSYHSPCNALCDDVVAYDYLNYPSGNRFAAVLLKNQPFRSMIDRRTRELAEEYLAAGVLEARMAQLLEQMGEEAARNRKVWGQYGDPQSMADAQQLIIDEFLADRRRQYLGPDSDLPAPQPDEPTLRIDGIETDAEGEVLRAVLHNDADIAIDVSNRSFDEIGAVLPAGSVIPAGGSLMVIFERVPVVDDGLRLVIVAGRMSLA